MDIRKMPTFHSVPAGAYSADVEFSDELETAALAIEQVLCAAHERGSVDAVIILSTVSGLLRDVARYRGQSGRVKAS